jgi:transcription initiation factor TFIID subunit 2
MSTSLHLCLIQGKTDCFEGEFEEGMVCLILFFHNRYGNYLEVRLTAFDSLFVLAGLLNNELTNYFLTVIKEDPCAYVSHYVSRAMLTWLGLALRDKTDTTHTKTFEEFAEEEGKVVIEDEKRRLQKTVQQEFQASVESLRKRFGGNTELQDNLWDLLK